jgi:hypothetical protein
VTPRTRVRRWALAAVLLVGAASVVTGSVGRPPRAGADGASGSTAVTVTKTVVRDHKNLDGTDTLAESDAVSATVAQTQLLRGRQQIDVSWSGAHPSGGISADPNSRDAPKQEFPFVIMECRGTPSQVTPQTCWTQSAPERYQSSFGDADPPWRVDRYAAAADREQFAQVPSPEPAACVSLDEGLASEHWLPFVAADGTSYPGGDGACGPVPPEAAQVDNDSVGSLPSNTTYASTSLNGTGSAKFDVWTDQENASLGCSAAVACSLVMIPIVGISCDVGGSGLTGADATAADEECRSSGDYAPGAIANANFSGTDNLAVTGYLWWSASNWDNRLTVPLGFAPDANLCSVTNSSSALSIYGSELLTEATTQWEPHFCLDPKLFNFQHVQTAEPEARTLLGNGSIDAAFGSQPVTAGSVPIAQAPVAVTGFAISYTIDDAQGHEYTKLKLDARLLAKLITESYPADNVVYSDTSHYGGVQGGSDIANNPVNITLDPEFIALNPGLKQSALGNTEAESTLIGLSSDSDVTNALTSYINDDPEARAWLNGAPDPWGMRVNANYRNLALPVDALPLLDPGVPSSFTGSASSNQCLADSPVPYLPLIEAPLNSLYFIAEAIQFGIPNSTTQCNVFGPVGSGEESLVSGGKQTVGSRFMIGVTSLGEAQRYGLDTAALQTSATPPYKAGDSAPFNPNEQFTDTTGRTFVAPSAASLQSAASLLVEDDSSGVWPIPYAQFRTGTRPDPADPTKTIADASSVYPGLMVVYADIPTQGLDPTEAGKYATLLRFIAGPGQTPGLDTGDLPAGYLPMTAANGLGALVSATLSAADAVAAQAAPVSAADNPIASDGGGQVDGPSGTAPSAASSPAPAAAAASSSANLHSRLVAQSSRTPGTPSSVAALALPALLVLLLVGGAAAGGILLRPRLGQRR